MSTCIIHHYESWDDHYIEVQRADDDIWIAKELLEKVDPRFIVIDWPFVAIRGKTTFAYYKITGEDFPRNAWTAKKVKAQCLMQWG